MESYEIRKPNGKLGVLIVGINGAVSTTFLAGVFAIEKDRQNLSGHYHKWEPSGPEREVIIIFH